MTKARKKRRARKARGALPQSSAAGPPKPRRGGSRSARGDGGRLTVERVARLLNVPAEVIRRHLEEGAPATPEGRINLVHYAAWLVLQLAGEKRSP